MKKVLAVVLVAAFVCVGAYGADAQVPLSKIVFDGDLGKDSKDCAVGLDTMSVVLANFNSFLGSIEFAIDYPPSIQYFPGSDLNIPNVAVSLGTSDVTEGPWFGISLGFGNNPVNAFSTVVVHNIQFGWDCGNNGCPGNKNELVLVVPNGLTGDLQGIDWPNGNFVPIVGGVSVVCPTSVPVEEQTWGQIKSLYSE
jgi:hypothetical protein